MSDRRGFLRQLVTLPMIGGGLTIIGQPTAVASPVTRKVLDTYDEWLFYERRLLHVERYGLEVARRSVDAVPCTQAMFFHFPTWGDDGPHTSPVPSTRARLVLSAVGCPIEYKG